ncbi:DUF4907 domain-containing protein [Alistipes sp. OttesenSCG-928-B03]|nr:DUF4907 domain-containing protein [Alistipes sp. OttesenSCG-928-B03]
MTNRQRVYLFAGIAAAVLGFVALTVHYTQEKRPYDYTLYRVDGGWGYDISHNGQTVVNQPFMPVVDGRRPFPDRAAARNAAVATINRFIYGCFPVAVGSNGEKGGDDSKAAPEDR